MLRELRAPRHPHGGEIPPVDFVAPYFRLPLGEGSSMTVGDLTRLARILDFVLRKTLLPRTGYRDGFTPFSSGSSLTSSLRLRLTCGI